MVDGFELIAKTTNPAILSINYRPSTINLLSNLNHLPKSVIAHWKTELCDKVEPVPEKQNSECKIQNSICRFDLGSPVLTPDPWFLLRKEVIQPQVPLRLPCYDFIPITIHTFGTF